MLKNTERIKKISLGAMFAALSVIINLSFDMWLNINTFGFPFYSIPLILAAIILGPKYGLIIGIVSDTTFGLIKGYYPWFVLSTIAWSTLPAFFNVKESKVKWGIMVVLTYLTATLSNSLAIYLNFKNLASVIAGLPLRLGVLIPFSIIIGIITFDTHKKLKEVLPREWFDEKTTIKQPIPMYLINLKQLKVSR